MSSTAALADEHPNEADLNLEQLGTQKCLLPTSIQSSSF